jgi:hypothetical protein
MLTKFDKDILEWVVTSVLTQRKFYSKNIEEARSICKEDDRIYARHHKDDEITNDQETI